MTENTLTTADTASDAALPPRSGLRWVLIGGDGLRAGWSILVFVILVVLLAGGVTLALKSLLTGAAATPQTAIRTIIGEAIPAAVLIIAALVMSAIERRPFARYGLNGQRIIPDLVVGMIWGVVMLSVLIGLLVVSGGLVIDGVALAPMAALQSGALWLAAFTMVGLFEEFLFRGYLQFTLARGMAGIARAVGVDPSRAPTIGFWIAAIILSVGLFAASHVSNNGETLVGIVGVAMAGVVLVFALWRTGSLWWAMGFHASWDWAQSYLYGVADSGLAVQGHLLNSHPVGNVLLSGGSVGPEGSILLTPVLILALLVIGVTVPKRAR